MSRFYGPGQPKINAGYQPRETVKKDQKAPKLQNTFVRFVLKTGDAFELSESSLDEVVGIWADRICKTVCGCRADGTKVCIPIENIAYLEEIK